MTLKIVPPLQDGNNCALVALCHAANYFGIKPNRHTYKNLDAAIQQWGNAFNHHIFEALPGFLRGLYVDVYVHPNKLDHYSIHRTQFILYRPFINDDSFYAECEAALACKVINTTDCHLEFRLDNMHFDNVTWFALIHQPGVSRKNLTYYKG